MRSQSTPKIAIIGAGMSGICLAAQLKRAGIDSFTIFEKSDQVGGTWAENTYPNAGCDIPSFLYSFSFHTKPDWTEKYARQPEILQYFRECADHYDLKDQIRFSCEVKSAIFDTEAGQWHIETNNGTEPFDYLVSAVGQLSRPAIPHIEGMDSFAGTMFHSARWPTDFDPTDRKIAVIGVGASAIQFLPSLCEAARQVYIFQRSDNWISPFRNYKYPKLCQQAFRYIPGLAKLHRLGIYLICEARFLAFRRNKPTSRIYRRMLRSQMKRVLPDDLYEQLRPTFPPGCKRILLSNDFFQTIQRENVQLIREGAASISPTGVSSTTEQCEVDAVVFATGFKSTEFLAPMTVVGRTGQTLEEAWRESPGAYLGMMKAQFPNFFMLYGPNTNLGHNSIIYMVECQSRFILRSIQKLTKTGKSTLEVEPSAEAEFVSMVQDRLRKTVWSEDCSSWYKKDDGTIVNNWCGTSLEYWWRTRKFDKSKMVTR